VKRLSFAMLLLASSAQAAPLCWPKEVQGAGSTAIIGSNDKYRYASWYCPDKADNGAYMQVTIIGEKRAAINTPGIARLGIQQALQRYWDANVTNDLKDPKYDATKAEVALRLSTEVVWPERP
jgi:hypothetical protein